MLPYEYLDLPGEISSDYNNNILVHLTKESETKEDDGSNVGFKNRLSIPQHHRIQSDSSERLIDDFPQGVDQDHDDFYDELGFSNYINSHDNELNLAAAKINDSESTENFSLGKMVSEGIYIFTEDGLENNYLEILKEYEKNGGENIHICSDVLVDQVSSEDFDYEPGNLGHPPAITDLGNFLFF